MAVVGRALTCISQSRLAPCAPMGWQQVPLAQRPYHRLASSFRRATHCLHFYPILEEGQRHRPSTHHKATLYRCGGVVRRGARRGLLHLRLLPPYLVPGHQGHLGGWLWHQEYPDDSELGHFLDDLWYYYYESRILHAVRHRLNSLDVNWSGYAQHADAVFRLGRVDWLPSSVWRRCWVWDAADAHCSADRAAKGGRSHR